MVNQKSIEKSSGPCVILAGAGTGKTYTIVEKIKYLVDKNIYPAEKIVCITFSNEAANNLILRMDKLLGLNEKAPIIRTFHGFSADLLRKYGSKIDIPEKFRILDPDQAKVVLHRNLRVNVNNCHKYISTIGTAKDLGIKISDFQLFIEKEMTKYKDIDLQNRLENLNFELQTLHLRKTYTPKKELVLETKKIRDLIDIRKFINSWNAYEKLKKKGNYLDYSDLNKYALELLEKFPEIANEFSYIIVDEFQDTNKLQLDFLIKLASHNNITVVGDINQSIYRFRGAYRENLSLFKKAFSVSEENIFNLNKSYRSPNTVLRTAHKLISKNYQNKEDLFFVENVNNTEGEKVRAFELKDAKEEARKIVELINEEVSSGTPPEEICVLFRAHQHGRIIKRALEQANIEYHSISKTSLLKQKSVKTVIDYLNIINALKKKESGSEQAWWDLVYQLNFEQQDLIKLGRTIKDFTRAYYKNKTIDTENKKEVISVYLFNNLDKLDLSPDGKLAAKVLIDKIKLMIPFNDKPISELIQEIYRISGLASEQKTIEEKEIMLNLSKFYEIAKAHEDLYDSELSNFLYYLSVLQDLGIDIDAPQLEESGVRLMTSHSTKGLEFKVVIITNLAYGRFPIERYINNSLIPTELLPEVKNEVVGLDDEDKEQYVINFEKHHQLQEERRLAYVSFTRAKEKLILTFAQEYSNKKGFSSIFLSEIQYKNNPDILFQQDLEQKYREESIKTIPTFSSALNQDNFPEILGNIVSEQKPSPEKEHKKFSPSALILYSNCQKEFEYRYVYNMPERKTLSWDAMRLGSFVHLVLEKGVKSCLKNAEEFLQLAKEIKLDEEWESIEFDEAETLIKVFFERNKDRYDKNSKTEQYLPLNLSDIEFVGFADRIDFSGDNVQIVDYKTGKTTISPKDRNWQLGFYALAAQEKFGKVKKVILDMLKQEKPIEFEIDSLGNAICTSSKYIDGFNINSVKEELIETARAIQNSYKTGFKPCPIDKNCDFCNEYVYRL